MTINIVDFEVMPMLLLNGQVIGQVHMRWTWDFSIHSVKGRNNFQRYSAFSIAPCRSKGYMARQLTMIAKGKAIVGQDNDNAEHVNLGKKRWFREIEGLNNVDYIPWVDLLALVMSKEKVVAMWGTKNIHNGYRYRHHTSNQQVRKMWFLYQWTH